MLDFECGKNVPLLSREEVNLELIRLLPNSDGLVAIGTSRAMPIQEQQEAVHFLAQGSKFGFWKFFRPRL